MTSTPKRDFGGTAKFQTLCEGLLEIARNLGPEAKLPTVVELRKTLGVSVSTLNFALKELEAQDLLVRRHGVGVYVSAALHRKNIALIFDQDLWTSGSQSPFWELLLGQANLRAKNHNEILEVHFAQRWSPEASGLPRGLTREIETGQLAGIIGVGLPLATSQWIEATNTPFVAIFGPSLGSRSASVLVDSVGLIKTGVAALHDAGCRRLAYMSSLSVRTTAPKINRQRDTMTHDFLLETFLASLEKHQLPHLGSLTLPWALGDEASSKLAQLALQEQGERMARQIFAAPKDSWPDGILVNNDVVAHGALQALANLGVLVGQDLEVATQANKGSVLLAGHPVPIILLEYDPQELVHTAFTSLEGLFQSKPRSNKTYFIHCKSRRSSGENRQSLAKA